MIDALSFVITLACLGTAISAGTRTVTGRFRWARIAPVLALIEAVLLVQAVLAALGLAGGHHPRELSTYLAYLVFSVLVVPIAVTQTRGDDGRWSALFVVAALLAVAVLVVRLQTTWRSASG